VQLSQANFFKNCKFFRTFPIGLIASVVTVLLSRLSLFGPIITKCMLFFPLGYQLPLKGLRLTNVLNAYLAASTENLLKI
jgi:hypothetical protein